MSDAFPMCHFSSLRVFFKFDVYLTTQHALVVQPQALTETEACLVCSLPTPDRGALYLR